MSYQILPIIVMRLYFFSSYGRLSSFRIGYHSESNSYNGPFVFTHAISAEAQKIIGQDTNPDPFLYPIFDPVFVEEAPVFWGEGLFSLEGA